MPNFSANLSPVTMMDQQMIADPITTNAFPEEQQPDFDQVPIEANPMNQTSPNLAENSEIVDEVKRALINGWSNVESRAELEAIWAKNDEMYRVAPDTSKVSQHRANTGCGIYHNGINQLTSMAYRTFTENTDNYRYVPRYISGDDALNSICKNNAEILTFLLRVSFSRHEFKSNLRKICFGVYKYGTVVPHVPWPKKITRWPYRDKATGELKYAEIDNHGLPSLEYLPLDTIWMDENIEDIEKQPYVFIRSPLPWHMIANDKDFIAPKDDGVELKDTIAKYAETFTTENESPTAERFENAARTYTQHSKSLLKHWVVWIRLPISDDKAPTWDENQPDQLYRVRILGDPSAPYIGEIRKNPFPDGIPLLIAHQCEDDVGAYHISLGEKVKDYHEQLCTAQNQLIDNRSKNTRRPIVRDPVRVRLDKYDFGHSEVIDCEGDVRSALAELQLIDMTGTIMATVAYNELKIKEIMNTTDAVVGQAMGGRTTANEYLGAKTAATTPIFADLADIEDSIIVAFMRKFAKYIHAYMTPADIVAIIGERGNEFQFNVGDDIYEVEAMGVSNAKDKQMNISNLLQLLNITQDQNIRQKITMRIAKFMDVENPEELAVIPATDQAVKAALFENNEILVYGQWDEPQIGEQHRVHHMIHSQGIMKEKQSEIPSQYLSMMIEHDSKHQMLEKQEQMGGVGNPMLSMSAGTSPVAEPGAPPQSPAEMTGQQISGAMGSQQAGSQIATPA